MDLIALIEKIDGCKAEIDALRPLDREQEQRIMQKFRMDWNYHSNAIEGNTLTYGETRAFLLYGVTAQGKPFRDYLDIKGHRDALEYLEQFVQQQHLLTEADLRQLHKVLLVESYEMPAITAEGLPTKRRTETPALMGELMAWYRNAWEQHELHPLLLAATFHLRFVTSHPFDDGNGRMARLLMNLILMQAGYVPVIININSKGEYLLALEKADVGEIEDFIRLIGDNLLRSLQLFLRAAKGQALDEGNAVVELANQLQQQLSAVSKTPPTQ